MRVQCWYMHKMYYYYCYYEFSDTTTIYFQGEMHKMTIIRTMGVSVDHYQISNEIETQEFTKQKNSCELLRVMTASKRSKKLLNLQTKWRNIASS